MPEWPIRDYDLCRFPIGDPVLEDFRFCEERTQGDLPYCEYHFQLCYIGLPKRKAKTLP